MKELLKGILNLIKIKSIMSLAVIFTTCYLTIKGELDTASFMALAGAIITYYFNKDDKKGDEIMSKSGLEEIEVTGATEGEEKEGGEE